MQAARSGKSLVISKIPAPEAAQRRPLSLQSTSVLFKRRRAKHHLRQILAQISVFIMYNSISANSANLICEAAQF